MTGNHWVMHVSLLLDAQSSLLRLIGIFHIPTIEDTCGFSHSQFTWISKLAAEWGVNGSGTPSFCLFRRHRFLVQGRSRLSESVLRDELRV